MGKYINQIIVFYHEWAVTRIGVESGESDEKRGFNKRHSC